MSLIFIFIDGLGLAQGSVMNPIYSGSTDYLVSLLEDIACPIDPIMGVAGTPQSATGQTSIFTGKNAPLFMGRHIEGFPGSSLVNLINDAGCIYDDFLRIGRTAIFANAYYVDNLSDVINLKYKAVSTVTALKSIKKVLCKDTLLNNLSVYHDLTRLHLKSRGYSGPIITPEQAAEHLYNLSASYDFVFFEYFLTDRMGHKSEYEDAVKVLIDLDRFLYALSNLITATDTLIVTSDHGNIEDLSVKSHTSNCVPFICIGKGCEQINSRVGNLSDIRWSINLFINGAEC